MYKSAYKNAMRVARTETNMAYRKADNVRWQQMDFVVGQRISLSKKHPCEDICDDLAGEYPKSFVFTGWHPQCFCYVTPILGDEDEMAKITDAFLEGKDYEPQFEQLEEYPKGFEKWVKDHKKQIEKSIKQGKEPYFVKDNRKAIEGIISATKLSKFSERPHYGSALKLGRSATKEAKKIYENIPAPILSRDVQKNTAKIASALGVKQGKPMTFLEANEGRANINYGKGIAFSENCQCCVAIHEARLRGLNLTAVGYSAVKDSVTFQLGENFQNIWVNAKTGKTPQLTILKADNDEALYSKLEKALSANGRYHIGINLSSDMGHVFTAERLPNGKLLFYDAQSGDFLNIREYTALESIEVLKVDKLLFNIELLKEISKVI